MTEDLQRLQRLREPLDSDAEPHVVEVLVEDVEVLVEHLRVELLGGRPVPEDGVEERGEQRPGREVAQAVLPPLLAHRLHLVAVHVDAGDLLEGVLQVVGEVLEASVQVSPVHLLPGLTEHLSGVHQLVAEDVVVHLPLDGVEVELALLGELLVRVRVGHDGQVLVEQADREDVAEPLLALVKKLNGVSPELHAIAQ